MTWPANCGFSSSVRWQGEEGGVVYASEDRDFVDGFIISGERRTDKHKKLVKGCEAPMMKAGNKSSPKGGRGKTPQLRETAEIEFVESFFWEGSPAGADGEIHGEHETLESLV